MRSLKPHAKVFVAEPCGINGVADVALSKQAGRLESLEATRTIAEGLRAQPGDNTWPVLRDLVDDVIVV